MWPELFKVPFVDLTVKSYGFMLVVGFLAAIYIIRRLSRDITPNPDMITNAALYSLISGVIGARLFYVIHYWEQFEGNLASVFAIWQGGLELLGGVVLAVTVILSYLLYHKLPVRKYLDILAVALLVALAFGRIGCFLNGCCYGKPCELAWGVRFPYGSFSYRSQVFADPDRGRQSPYMVLPDDYFIEVDGSRILKEFDILKPEQKKAVTEGRYRALAVHPTQLYSSLLAVIWAGLLYLLWKRNNSPEVDKRKFCTKPGCVFALMLMIYSVGRFVIEYIRDDNPFELDGLTVSQNISIGMFVGGLILMAVFSKMRVEQDRKKTVKEEKMSKRS